MYAVRRPRVLCGLGRLANVFTQTAETVLRSHAVSAVTSAIINKMQPARNHWRRYLIYSIV